VLAQTRTMLDEYHLMNAATLAQTQNTSVVDVLSAKGAVKYFYPLSAETMPAVFRQQIPSDAYAPVVVGGEPALPLYIGAAEARMMVMERLFRSPGDVIENLFGNRVVIAGVLRPTYGPLDEMHYAGPELALVSPAEAGRSSSPAEAGRSSSPAPAGALTRAGN
jgi:hypothetical protein